MASFLKILKWVFIIAAFWILYLYPVIFYWIKQMEQPWTLKFLFGKMGVGKSGLIAIYATKDLQDPTFERVYTSTGVPGTYKFNPEDINKGLTFPPKSSIYIDEVGLLYNSREFKTFSKTTREFFKYARQYKLKITVFSQAPDVDKTIRDLCHGYGLLRRVGPFVILFDVCKNIDVGSDINGNGQLVDNYFRLGLIGGIHIYYLPRYFGLWDSYAPPYKDLIYSEYVKPTPTLVRSLSFKKWFKKNFVTIYHKQIGRISAVLRDLRQKYKNTLLLTSKSFIKLQMFNIRKEVLCSSLDRGQP